jgi:hypothetical protein
MAAAVVIAGRGGGSALSLDPVAAAATKSQQAGAARIRFSLAVRGPQGQTVRLHGAGAIDGTSGRLTMQMGSIPGQSLIPPGTTLKEIFLEQNGDYVVYVGLGALSSQIPGGKHWVELNVSKLGKSAGIDLGKLLSGSEMQPSDLLGMLKAEGAKIQSLGPATIDGTATTHYRVTVDLAKALQAKGLTSPLLAGMAARMPKVPEEVWVGKDGLVRRIGLSLALPQGHMQMKMDLYDYGADVSIAAPPSSDVFDATAFAQQGLAGSLH